MLSLVLTLHCSVLVFLSSTLSMAMVRTPNPEENYNITQLIESRGYPFERHVVRTADGYLLDLHRIPHAHPRAAVVLQHGLLEDSASWVLQEHADQNLPFVLHQAGMDVWLANSRGNRYAKRHETLSPEDDNKLFWDFSMDEMAEYDLPAVTSYVAKRTPQMKRFYVGYSQGTFIAFVGFQNRSVSSLYDTAFLLAPVFNVGHVNGPFHLLASFANWISRFYHMLNDYEFLEDKAGLIKFIGDTVCHDRTGAEILCRNALFLMAGADYNNLNISRLPVYLAHVPSPTSVRDMLHWAQLMKSGRASRFDFGPKRNMAKYGHPHPPEYHLSGYAGVRTVIFNGGHDIIANPTDVRYICDHLNKSTIVKQITINKYNHLDFQLGEDVFKHVYQPVLAEIESRLHQTTVEFMIYDILRQN